MDPAVEQMRDARKNTNPRFISDARRAIACDSTVSTQPRPSRVGRVPRWRQIVDLGGAVAMRGIVGRIRIGQHD